MPYEKPLHATKKKETSMPQFRLERYPVIVDIPTTDSKKEHQ
jgi:hypothetical protein